MRKTPGAYCEHPDCENFTKYMVVAMPTERGRFWSCGRHLNYFITYVTVPGQSARVDVLE